MIHDDDDDVTGDDVSGGELPAEKRMVEVVPTTTLMERELRRYSRLAAGISGAATANVAQLVALAGQPLVAPLVDGRGSIPSPWVLTVQCIEGRNQTAVPAGSVPTCYGVVEISQGTSQPGPYRFAGVLGARGLRVQCYGSEVRARLILINGNQAAGFADMHYIGHLTPGVLEPQRSTVSVDTVTDGDATNGTQVDVPEFASEFLTTFWNGTAPLQNPILRLRTSTNATITSTTFTAAVGTDGVVKPLPPLCSNILIFNSVSPGGTRPVTLRFS